MTTTFTPCPKPAPRAPKSRTPVKSRNAKRRRREFARAFGSDARVLFVRSLRCLVDSACAGEIQNHHIVTGGRGRKADARNIVPLCFAHHRQLHDVGQSNFAEWHGIDFPRAASETDARWRAFNGEDDA